MLTVTTLDELERRYGDSADFVLHFRVRLRNNGITQRAFALFAEIDPSHLNRWLQGHVTPSLRTMVRLDAALDRMIYGE
jgi:transcriptional regulator with XRE-family HTH domain